MIDLKAHLEKLQKRFDRLVEELSAQDVTANAQRFQDLRREHSRLAPLIQKAGAYQQLLKEEQDLQSLLQASDAEMHKLAEEDLKALNPRKKALEEDLQLALLPRDPNEDRNILMEIRAGAGGDEAGLFAADLLRMYTRSVEKHGWKMEPIEASTSERGGIKEVILQISGPGVWNHFKFERGVHRVQRVPTTEASGRIHTSTATVAVLPEAEEVDVQINPADLRIDTYRASGAGGQHINKTDSAVRITHEPSGLVVACQEERSQIKNRAKAMRLLRSRLLQRMQEKHEQEISQDRRNQVGTGDRSEKIRTYNFPQDRITDHRINFNLHNLPAVMEGEIDPLIAELQKHEKQQRLTELGNTLEAHLTLRERLETLIAQFKSVDIQEATLEAQYILAAVLGCKRTQLLLDLDTPYPPEQEARLQDLIQKRMQRIPLAYVLEEQPFMDLSLWVSQDVLIPRPETEELVEHVQKLLGDFKDATLVDVGTGSGNIAISLARDPRVKRVSAVDISPAALAVAQRNAQTYQIDTIDWYLGDLLAPLQRLGTRFDFIVANLPYVRSRELADFSPEALCEPRVALHGGVEGLDLIGRLISEARNLVSETGFLVLEIGADQSTEVCRLLLEADWEGITVFKDLAGLSRIVQAQKKSLAQADKEVLLGSVHR